MSSGTLPTKKRGHPAAEDGKAGMATKRATTDTSLPSTAAVAVVVTNQMLQLAAQWLDPKELAKCTRVCKQWHKCINNDKNDGTHSEHTWKQAALNVTSQASLDALEAAIQIQMPGDEKKQFLGYRNMAKGLACSPDFTDERTPIEWKPQVTAEDIVFLLEVKAFGSVVHASCKTLKDVVNQTWQLIFLDFHDLPEIAIQIPQAQFELSYWSSDTVEDLVLTNTKVSLTMWRRDTGKFYSFCKGEEIRKCYPFRDHLRNAFRKATVLRRASTQPTKATMAGIFAGSMCMEKKINHMDPEIVLHAYPMTPFCDSIDIDEMTQLPAKGSSRCSIDFRKTPLAKLGKSRLSHLSVKFMFSFGGNSHTYENERAESVISKENLLLFMEGLDWK